MDFSTVTKIVIPEGEVTKITSGSVVLWQKVTEEEVELPTRDVEGTIETSGEYSVECSDSTGSNYTSGYPENCIVLRLYTTTTDGVISEVTASSSDGSSCTIKYYDAASNSTKSTSGDIETLYSGNGAKIGFSIDISGSTTNGADIRFDGDYYWGWDKP